MIQGISRKITSFSPHESKSQGNSSPLRRISFSSKSQTREALSPKGRAIDTLSPAQKTQRRMEGINTILFVEGIKGTTERNQKKENQDGTTRYQDWVSLGYSLHC